MRSRMLLIAKGIPPSEPWLETCAGHLEAACAGSGRMKFVMKSVLNRAYAPQVFDACLALYEAGALPKPPVFSALTWAFRIKQESLTAHLGGVERTVACFRELREVSPLQKPVTLWRGVTEAARAHGMLWRADVGVAALFATGHADAKPWCVVRSEVQPAAILHFETKVDVRVTVDPARLGPVYLEDCRLLTSPRLIEPGEVPEVPQTLLDRWMEKALIARARVQMLGSLRFR